MEKSNSKPDPPTLTEKKEYMKLRNLPSHGVDYTGAIYVRTPKKL